MFILKSEVSSDLAEALEAHFCEEGLLAWGIESVPGGPLILKGFFETEPEADAGLAGLREAFAELPAYFAREHIEDREWQEAYKEFLKPWSNGRLHWVPAWERETYAVPTGHVARRRSQAVPQAVGHDAPAGSHAGVSLFTLSEVVQATSTSTPSPWHASLAGVGLCAIAPSTAQATAATRRCIIAMRFQRSREQARGRVLFFDRGK